MTTTLYLTTLLLVTATLASASSYGKPRAPNAYNTKPYNNNNNYNKKDYNKEIPVCSKNTTKSWCLTDPEYPLHDVQYALEEHYDSVLSLYKDVALRTENSVNGLKKLSEETYLCPSVTSYVQPLRAVNAEGKWRIIVNRVEAKYYSFTQSARIEECDAKVAGKPCPLVPDCYDSECLQKNVYHRFLIYDPYDYYFPFAVENFKLPASCACKIDAFSL